MAVPAGVGAMRYGEWQRDWAAETLSRLSPWVLFMHRRYLGSVWVADLLAPAGNSPANAYAQVRCIKLESFDDNTSEGVQMLWRRLP